MVTTVLAAVFLLSAPNPAQAQGYRDWNDSVDTLEGGIGLHYGKLGGHGLSFRLPLEWWLYFQVSGGIWHTAGHKQHNIGFQANYILRQDQRTRIFIAAGTAYFFDHEEEPAGVWTKEKNWNLGAGVGLEYLMGKRWSLKIEGDFAHLGSSGDIKVIPQAGIYYYW
ncbi:MAG: hypothetical protein ABFS42_02990 [Candidatus Krumholzibacteriota bacterium]